MKGIIMIVSIAVIVCVFFATPGSGSGNDPAIFPYDIYEPTVLEDGIYPPRKTTKCYQCAYSPPRMVEEKVKVPVEDANGKISYQTKYVMKEKQGGWDKCRGPFDDARAVQDGIDVWDCESNCYTRTDKNGNVFRGCYRGEFGVNPQLVGCTLQAGSYYCFCDGNRCNNKRAENFPSEGDYLVEQYQLK